MYIKGSVPSRPVAKIRKFDNSNCLHCLVSLVFFNVLTLIRINYQCSKLNTYLVTTIFLSEWGYCVYIEIPLRVSPAPSFRALKNMSAVMLRL